METLQVSLLLAKLTLQLLFLQTQVADAQTPIVAPTSPVVAVLAPPGIESLVNYQNLLKIENCESGGKYVVVLDVDGYYSYGHLQFHLQTFINFGLKYGFLDKGDDYRTLIKSRELQFRIADKMLSDGLWRQWYNCLK